MSVKEHYEVITHEVTEKFLVGKTMYCDVCKKEICKGQYYWSVDTGDDYDWIEDDKHLDVCSDICLMMEFSDYMDDAGKDDGNTKYIKVQRSQLSYN